MLDSISIESGKCYCAAAQFHETGTSTGKEKTSLAKMMMKFKNTWTWKSS